MKKLVLCLVVALFSPLAAQDAPLFTADFSPEEFSARQAKIFDAIGPIALALIQGAPSPPGYVKFRQSNEFYYLSGVESPHAYLLQDGGARRTTLFLPRRNEAREPPSRTRPASGCWSTTTCCRRPTARCPDDCSRRVSATCAAATGRSPMTEASTGCRLDRRMSRLAA
jgi:hypothetical protein